MEALEVLAKTEEVDLQIEGIDVVQGIRLTGGTVEDYLFILDIFRKDTAQRIGLIRDSLQDDDLSLFVTYVHSIKSAAASIGATSISAMAGRLEHAGRNKDRDYIQTSVEAFQDKLSEMVERIGQFRTDEGGEVKNEDVPVKLLEKLKRALEELNTNEFDKIVEQLPDTALMRKLAESLQMFEYDEAAAIIKEALQQNA